MSLHTLSESIDIFLIFSEGKPELNFWTQLMDRDELLPDFTKLKLY